MGILNPVEPILLSKKLWDDNRIIMVSDGVLDALPGEDKELSLLEFIAGMPVKNPQDMADRILLFARSFHEFVGDDMTVPEIKSSWSPHRAEAVRTGIRLRIQKAQRLCLLNSLFRYLPHSF